GNSLQSAHTKSWLIEAVDSQPDNTALPPFNNIVVVREQLMLAERPLQQHDLRSRTGPKSLSLRCLFGHETSSIAITVYAGVTPGNGFARPLPRVNCRCAQSPDLNRQAVNCCLAARESGMRMDCCPYDDILP